MLRKLPETINLLAPRACLTAHDRAYFAWGAANDRLPDPPSGILKGESG